MNAREDDVLAGLMDSAMIFIAVLCNMFETLHVHFMSVGKAEQLFNSNF